MGYAKAQSWGPFPIASLGRGDYPGLMLVLENIISDRGSRYAVSGGPCASADEAAAFLKELKRKKKFAKATHNTWACLTDEAPLKNDDGESGAGMVILRMLEREGVTGEIVVVTRWYGGKHLGGDRFRHVQDAVRMYLDARA
ncbi:Uncharacterized protein family UPF0029 [Tropicibacter naphthalenivorans]|uniref:Impact N-terminal domain-containing protein n=2 Tax=Tropicibacter naphthalenivorans TaxID=441103 RepID=A0A0P1G9F3_9RHOB|nr:hypothetical protein TRN7648_01787 [Tropicibacter naphthalenivorans]SMC93667.1 Uncharacterized protein family UPF0029 [Tropicibacter naphthalenivorans]